MPALRDVVVSRWQDPVQRSGLFMIATTAITSVLGFAYWIAAARIVEPAAVGLAAAALSAMTLASFASNLGGNSALLQLLPPAGQRERSGLLGAILALGTVAGVVGGAIAVGLMALDQGTRLNGAQALLVIVGVVAQTTQVSLSHAWLALRRGGVMLAAETTFAVGKLAALPLATDLGTSGLVGGWVAASVVSCGASLILVWRLEKLTPLLTGLAARLRAVRPVLAGNHLVNVGNTLPVYLMPPLVAARLGQAQAAYFYAAWQIGSFFYVVASSAANALQAEGSRDPALLSAYARRATLTACVVLVPLGILVAIVGKPILSVYGPGYVAGYGLLVTMALAAQPDVVTNIYSAVLRTTRRFRAAVGLSWTSVVLKLALTWVLLDVAGLAAAGIAFLLAQLVGAAWCVFDERRTRLDSPVSEAPVLEPQVTIVVTAYNQADVIRKAVDSALDQREADVEVVLVDDGSEDDPSAAVSGLERVTLIRQSNAGVNSARNTGLEAARGSFVVFLDGDDALMPEAAATGLRHFAANPELDFVVGRARHVGPEGELLGRAPHAPRGRDLYRELLRRPWIYPPSAVMWRTGPVRSLGGFDATLPQGGEDLDLYLRAARSLQGVDHDECVVDYRWEGGVTADTSAMLARNLAVLDLQRPFLAGSPELQRALEQGRRYMRWLWNIKAAQAAIDGPARPWRTALQARLRLLLALVRNPLLTGMALKERIATR